MSKSEKKIFNIQKENLPRLKAKLAPIIRKANKLGLQAPHLKVIREWVKEVPSQNDIRITYQVEMVEIEVDDLKASLSGWSFLGTIDHHEAGNIIRFNPDFQGEVNVDKYREAKPNCDHCKHQRNRKDTFLMVNESGETKQIGRSCIKDFLGHPSAEYYAQWAEWIYEASEEEKRESYSGKWVELYDIQYVLEAAAMLIRMHGYRSAKAVGAPTSGQLRYWLNTQPYKYRKEMNEEKPEPTAEDKETAQKAFDLVMSWEGADLRSNFNVNLQILCKRGRVTDRDLGMACYMPEMLMKTLAKQIEEARKRKEREAIAKISQYVGSLKERITLEADLTRCIYLGSNQFGDSYLYSFLDSDGNVIVWKTGKELKINSGTKVSITGTVKEHREYHDVKQTHLTRCKIKIIESS